MNIGRAIDLSGQRLEYDPVRGESLTEVFEGSVEACLSKAIGLRQARPDISFVIETAEPPLWRISTKSPDFNPNPTAEDVTTLWELHGNAITRDIYEAPFTLGISQSQIDAVRQAMLDETSVASATSVTEANAQVLLKLLKRGTTSFQVSQYVLRRTQLLSLKSEVRASFSNVERVFTTAQLVTGALSIGLPAAILFSIAQIPDPVPPDPALYHPGWLKQTPSVTQVGSNKFQIMDEWWLETWSKHLYPSAA